MRIFFNSKVVCNLADIKTHEIISFLHLSECDTRYHVVSKTGRLLPGVPCAP